MNRSRECGCGAPLPLFHVGPQCDSCVLAFGSVEVPVTVKVLDPACLDAAADALSDRGMTVLYRVRRKDDGLVVGEVSRTDRPRLDLVVGCQVKEA